ncbi:glycosyltransferase family A protein [Parasedimentitalea huanghaiensis]|uniref:Glycosyl transferase family 2 n=1 Tax=Parasedimentitalea huanghaiensis TaxID=2682100 RepID=A0A6L6WSK2_9RHOB|nr:glycosyltransferase family A protein [Zongyanglinia huanghaiensis]MVO18522.1 hypothetical protein [Zongyanglinia huanghaiensis]
MPVSNGDPVMTPPEVCPADYVTVAVSTLGAGLLHLRLPDPCAGITYLILVQQPQAGAAEVFANRSDVRVVLLGGIGLSNSRNAALDQAETALLLFADDDMILDLQGIQTLAECFKTDPQLALAAGWRTERLPAKAEQVTLTRFNSGRICAPEFMVRRAAVQAAQIRFDPDFGLGAHHGLGEDYVFVTDLLRAGLTGISVPVATGSHPHASTGGNWVDPKLNPARQAVLTRVFGRMAPLIRLVYALRHRKRLGGLGAVIRFIWLA